MAEKTVNNKLSECLAARGLRFTSQREHVYHVVLEAKSHPTAEQVFLRAKESMPDISLATVYNCLDALVKCRLVKEVHLNRDASRFCPNMREHYHFFCWRCGEVYDIDIPTGGGEPPLELPSGFRPERYEVAVQGYCPDCGRIGERTENGGRRNE